MARDSAATRARILAAAIEEFGAHGLAGARIDRIAEAAEANKRSIYVYYGSKDALFEAAMTHVVEDISASVPLDTDDLPAYMGRIFDYYLAHPSVVRMAMWLPLERPVSGPNETQAYAKKVAALSSSGGAIDGLPASDLVMFVNALAQSWFMSPDSLLAADGLEPRSEERARVHRAALVEAVRRIVAG
ncbi:MAG: TetR family transcriptional regulator [Solirubrobacteraceae bacterium]|nr:TetR family transcriptional regulator [Solirubrobacteraceae bacterium]